jgi:hypothetical protein
MKNVFRFFTVLAGIALVLSCNLTVNNGGDPNPQGGGQRAAESAFLRFVDRGGGFRYNYIWSRR